jgi:hypothetical protein
MNKLRFTVFALFLAVLPAQVRPADGVPAAAIAARVKQTKARIEVMFRHRNDAPAAVEPNQNPFRTPSDASSASSIAPGGQPTDTQPPAEPTSDDVLLKRAVATLKISGTVVIGDQVNVTINQETYREGGNITVRVLGAPVYLHIRRITPNSVTFALNDSELIQPF